MIEQEGYTTQELLCDWCFEDTYTISVLDKNNDEVLLCDGCYEDYRRGLRL